MIAHYEDTGRNTFFSQLINLKKKGSVTEHIEKFQILNIKVTNILDENLIDVLNNVSAVLIVVLLSQMYRFQEEWIGDTGQVGRSCPHFMSEWFHTLCGQKAFQWEGLIQVDHLKIR